MAIQSKKSILWLLIILVIIVLVLVAASIWQLGVVPDNLNNQIQTTGAEVQNTPSIAPDDATPEPTTAEQSLDETSATLSALLELNADLDSAGLDDLTDDLDDLDSQLNKL